MMLRTIFRKAKTHLQQSFRVARRSLHQQRCRGRLCVDIRNPRNGFFAHLEWVLELLAHQHLSGTPVDVRLSSPQYVSPTRGTDFLKYFFVSNAVMAPTPPDTPWFVIEEMNELGFSPSYDLVLNVELAHTLFFARYAFQPDFAAECEATRERLLEDHRTLGVHFRGTDKRRCAPRALLDTVFSVIDEQLTRHPNDTRIFVATDEVAFLDHCVARYGQRVVWLEDHLRSGDGQPVHLGREVDGYQLGRDALLNCWMLSRCDTVIKTASILSAWAKVLNPSLPIYAVTRGKIAGTYFPERDIPDYSSTIAS